MVCALPASLFGTFHFSPRSDRPWHALPGQGQRKRMQQQYALAKIIGFWQKFLRQGQVAWCSPFYQDAAALHPAVIPAPTMLFCHSRHCLTVGADFVLASF
jgi:hypothetical protein